MIIEDYIEHLKNTLGAAIEANINGATYSFHNELYYDDKANINITVKALPGQIQLGIAQYPIQLMFEVNEQFKDEFINVLDTFALGYNEQLVTLDGEDYREYYSTSTVVGTFQNRGTCRNVALTMDANIVGYNNFIMGESKWLKVLVSGSYVALQGVTGIHYKCQNSFDGIVPASGVQRNYFAGTNEVITVDGLAYVDDTARLYFKAHRKDNISFSIKYYDGETTESYTMKLVSYDDNGVIGNRVAFQISLMQKG